MKNHVVSGELLNEFAVELDKIVKPNNDVTLQHLDQRVVRRKQEAEYLLGVLLSLRYVSVTTSRFASLTRGLERLKGVEMAQCPEYN